MKCPACKIKMDEKIYKETRQREGGIFFSCPNLKKEKCNRTVWLPENKITESKNKEG